MGHSMPNRSKSDLYPVVCGSAFILEIMSQLRKCNSLFLSPKTNEYRTLIVSKPIKPRKKPWNLVPHRLIGFGAHGIPKIWLLPLEKHYDAFYVCTIEWNSISKFDFQISLIWKKIISSSKTVFVYTSIFKQTSISISKLINPNKKNQIWHLIVFLNLELWKFRKFDFQDPKKNSYVSFL